MNTIKRELWELWKEGQYWKVQFPKGIATFRTKTVALKFIEAFSIVRGNDLLGIADIEVTNGASYD